MPHPTKPLWLICKSVQTRAGIKLSPLPGLGADSLLLHADTSEQALVNARRFADAAGFYGRLEAIAVDRDGRPVMQMAVAS